MHTRRYTIEAHTATLLAFVSEVDVLAPYSGTIESVKMNKDEDYYFVRLTASGDAHDALAERFITSVPIR